MTQRDWSTAPAETDATASGDGGPIIELGSLTPSPSSSVPSRSKPSRPLSAVLPESPQGRRAAATLIVAIVLAFVAGIGVGFGIDHRSLSGSASPANTPAPSSAAAVVGAPVPVRLGDVGWGNATCSGTAGKRLDLGTKITNSSPDPIELTAIMVIVPAHGVILRGTSWTDCIGATGPAGAISLAPGASVWASATTDVSVKCLSKLSFTLAVSYVRDDIQMFVPPTRIGGKDLLPGCAGS